MTTRSPLHPDLIERLQTADPDRYRAALLADEGGRARLMTLYAFHAELAKVPELVSEPMIGQIRYQWWRDAVGEIYGPGEVRRHEVTEPLAALVAETGLPRFWLDQLIDGRERDLDPRPFTDLADATRYVRDTSGVLMQMGVKVLGAEVGQEKLVSAGTAWGLTGLARSWRFYTNGMLSSLDFRDVLAAARTAHARVGAVPTGAMPAMAYVALVPGFISRMSRPGHDPAKSSVTYGPLAKRARMLRATLGGKI